MITQPQTKFIRDLLNEREVSVEHASRLRERLAAGNLSCNDARSTIDWLKRRPFQTALTQVQINNDELVMHLAVQQAEQNENERVAAYKASTAEPEFDSQTLEIGIYELAGNIYKISWNKPKTRKYAMRLTYDVGTIERFTASGEKIKAEYEYARGAIFNIRPEYRITGERAEQLMIVFSNCLVCGRHLKAAASVARAIGPVCWKKI
jgi:hypothetical protein